MATVINGKEIAANIRSEIAKETEDLKKEKGIIPGLAVVLVGEDPASKVYVGMKEKACIESGFHSKEHKLSAETSEEELIALIKSLNADDKIHGILVQLPLPDHINETRVLETVSPSKDVDGFHPYNVGCLLVGKPSFQPCTPYGIIKMLEQIGIEIEGKEAVVVGRSNIVGKPIALMLLQKNATVTVCHSRTKNLKEKVKSADIVIAAVGKPEMIKGDWIKPGAVVIDVGVNRVGDKKLVGDVEFEAASKVASAITPVPGGVGPMTITMLLYNTLYSAKQKAGIC
ncbi:MAG: bifunctional methylenetetrahydrofolate dehydrogenase/methenyltetrahydrofolate cyclohydrolase FolD [Proteobacteria bacterium]|nr:bifunctional methylenetetrahydrofolate dehydrogenase/methenyltetrahydrofolate cyclohydrolase FolD [Pseudomonadota bacterium]